MGKDGTAGSATSADDVLVGGKLEVDGVAYFDGGATLGGAIAGGDQAFTGVGDMTFTDGSILAAVDGAGTTLLLKAGGLSGTTFITLTSQNAGTDTMALGAFTLGGTVTGNSQIISGVGAFSAASVTSTADIRISGAGDLYIPDDRTVKFGAYAANDYGILYETKDANAQATLHWFRVTDANQVPVAIFCTAAAVDVDLGFFNGITQPRVAVVDVDIDNWCALGYSADDLPALWMNGVQVVGAQQTGVAAQKVDYATPGLDTEAEIIVAFNTTNAAINTIRTALNAHGLTTTV